MDSRRFDALVRSFGEVRSRRGVVRFLGGLGAGLVARLPTEPLTAKSRGCRPPCGECQECHKGKCFKHHGRKGCKAGTCKPKANGIRCSNGGTCEAGVCVSFGGCPPACPTCTACPSPAALCEAQPNGQPGHQCEKPKVCCNGACCDPIHECNDAGRCATCAEVCPKGCELCLSTSEGRTFCSTADCAHCTGTPCKISSDCGVDAPFANNCVISVTDRATNTTTQGCGFAVGAGVCWDFIPCGQDGPPCSTCQRCHPTNEGICEAQTNGQSGRNCEAPKVCCNGTCCDPIHQCNSKGECATCAESCTDTHCAFCLARVTGGRICAGRESSCRDQHCVSDDDCNNDEFCVTSVTDRSTNATTQGCGEPVGTGICWHNVACSVN
jgi:hypothetical protein